MIFCSFRLDMVYYDELKRLDGMFAESRNRPVRTNTDNCTTVMLCMTKPAYRQKKPGVLFPGGPYNEIRRW